MCPYKLEVLVSGLDGMTYDFIDTPNWTRMKINFLTLTGHYYTLLTSSLQVTSYLRCYVAI